jgi:hypothetical protein
LRCSLPQTKPSKMFVEKRLRSPRRHHDVTGCVGTKA